MHNFQASITQLLALTPAHGPWRKKLADNAIKWSANNGQCPTGDPSLHQYLGELYYKGVIIPPSDSHHSRASLARLAQRPKLTGDIDRQFVLAEQHLLAAGKRDAAKLLAEMMFEWCARL
jgi:hypothetical protein